MADTFSRGGLASQASSFYERSHTNLVLWRKEIERGGKAAPPDLIAIIAKVLHEPSSSSVEVMSLSHGIALCRIHEQSGTMLSNSYASEQLHRIVFSFSTHVAALGHFKEGRIVRIHQPWREISLGYNQFGSPPTKLFPDFSVSFPFSSADPDVPINDTTLLCSRFVIL
jgi:hypothetical protein